jgi:hypothetical protein
VFSSYEVPSAPPWSKVIGTTLRLWLQRRVLRVPDGPGTDRLVRRRALAAGVPASFGSGTSSIAVWVTAPDGAAAYLSTAAVLQITFTAPCPLGLLSAQPLNS